MSAHTWWRVKAVSFVTYAAVSEVEMADTIGGPNLCVGGQAHSDSDYDSNHAASGAFDGNLSQEPPHVWVSGDSPNGWIGYQFPSPVHVRELRMVGRPRFPQYIRDFEVQWSDDGVFWTTVFSGTMTEGVAGVLQTFLVDMSGVPIRAAAPRMAGFGTVNPRAMPITNSIIPARNALRRNFTGNGYLAGESPDGLTKVEGVPTSAEVRVLYRGSRGDPADGHVVRVVQSNAGGAWLVDGLDSKLKYDVVARLGGHRDVIMSNVSPHDPPRFEPSTVVITVGEPLDLALPIIGGRGAVAVNHLSGSYPHGVALVDGRLVGAWPTGPAGEYPVTFEMADDLGTYSATLALVLELRPLTLTGDSITKLWVGTPVQVAFTAEGGEGPYAYSISAGTLPAGLTLDPNTGILSGTPISNGVYAFTVSAEDARTAVADLEISVSVLAPREYWRILVTANNGYGYVNLVELLFNGAQATGGSPIYSSQYDSGAWSAATAFDGVVTGDYGWSSVQNDVNGAYIGYRFASPIAVDSVTIVARNTTTGNTGVPRDFRVQSSSDGATWTDEWGVTGQTGWGFNEVRVFDRP